MDDAIVEIVKIICGTIILLAGMGLINDRRKKKMKKRKLKKMLIGACLGIILGTTWICRKQIKPSGYIPYDYCLICCCYRHSTYID